MLWYCICSFFLLHSPNKEPIQSEEKMLKSKKSDDVDCNGAKCIGFNSSSNSEVDGIDTDDAIGAIESNDAADASDVEEDDEEDDLDDTADADADDVAESADVIESVDVSVVFNGSDNGSCIEHANIKASILHVSSPFCFSVSSLPTDGL